MPISTQLAELSAQMADLRKQMAELRAKQPPEPVSDYTLTLSTGEAATLSTLFGDKKELVVIHNMGRRCPYCTLWADGFNGVAQHLENRAALVVTSPDAPDVQTAFAKSRGWTFRMASTDGTTFAKDLGFQTADGAMPGVSVLVKTATGLARVARDEFGPGDDYCQVWHLFDLLPGGAGGWQPKFAYPTSGA